MEKIVRLLIKLNITLIVIAAGLALGLVIRYAALKVALPYTYIKSINTPTYGNDYIKSILQQYNLLATSDIVSYNGYRSITIEESTLPRDSDKVMLGLAEVGIASCKITLSPTLLTPYQLHDVVIHEYNHCFGLEHTTIVNDLMFPMWSAPIGEQNTRQYANYLVDLIYGK